mmetsp:Transcript_34873/g.77518  ORF Transcript_34873/g.77518 Transcript_34873/m.77518 type:complete len:311 (-) Transcript_34873:280-1212(-)|eukprot:CAMPEP_0202892006 /NCGR_PEP_ID=MMETSP1392-20130828/1879_1 /ASSEMBLY_ACC=CAM_ASM_000868 /TAXON_ID=225041 /ORGANISM="Chlamydomonas chlamydogama, Strain SAG 11-48b" /LENGTH=310 /DNA_ID=CAMNT_0049575881 /DNA_START=114 /DNA_END=1046 /DNA_ORIENTATION=+
MKLRKSANLLPVSTCFIVLISTTCCMAWQTSSQAYSSITGNAQQVPTEQHHHHIQSQFVQALMLEKHKALNQMRAEQMRRQQEELARQRGAESGMDASNFRGNDDPRGLLLYIIPAACVAAILITWKAGGLRGLALTSVHVTRRTRYAWLRARRASCTELPTSYRYTKQSSCQSWPQFLGAFVRELLITSSAASAGSSSNHVAPASHNTMSTSFSTPASSILPPLPNRAHSTSDTLHPSMFSASGDNSSMVSASSLNRASFASISEALSGTTRRRSSQGGGPTFRVGGTFGGATADGSVVVKLPGVKGVE